MSRSERVIVGSSIVCILCLTISMVRYHWWSDWRDYQRHYAEAKLARGGDTAVPFAIQEIEVAELGRVDRCTTCHIGIEDPAMAGETQPLRKHPGDLLELHPAKRFGCTICHDGQGHETTFDAHGERNWPKPLLSGAAVESTCARCHDHLAPARVATYARGQHLFDTHGCRGCHVLRGEGGIMAPDLTYIGDASIDVKHAKTSERDDFLARYHGNENLAYIHESIKSPVIYPDFVATIMPDFHFDDDDLGCLSIYLKAQTKLARALRDAPIVVRANAHNSRPQVSAKRGKVLATRYCVGCHGQGLAGGVKNFNSIRGAVPRLDNAIDKMFLDEDTAPLVIGVLERGETIESNAQLQEELRSVAMTASQLDNLRSIILNGSFPGRARRDLPPPPIPMPPWRLRLEEEEIDSILAYLLTLGADEDEDGEH